VSEGVDTGERIDVGTGPGVHLDLAFPAAAQITLNFEWQNLEGSPDTPPTLLGITPAAVPPHAVTDPNAVVTAPYRCNNLIIDNPNVVNSIIYTINGGLSCELFGEDAISFDKHQVVTLLLEGQAADRVVIHAW
jgi:hypothetical protein